MQDIELKNPVMQRCGLGAGLRRGLLLASLLALGAFAAEAPAIELKLATVAPDGTAWMREMRAGAELIEERTEGRVQFKFYPGGVMGNDAQVLRRMRVGQIHGGAFAVSGMLDRYSAIGLYGVPLTDSIARRNRLCPRANGSGLECRAWKMPALSRSGS